MALYLGYLMGLDLFDLEVLFYHILLEVLTMEEHMYLLLVEEECKEQVVEDTLEELDMVVKVEAYKYLLYHKQVGLDKHLVEVDMVVVDKHLAEEAYRYYYVVMEEENMVVEVDNLDLEACMSVNVVNHFHGYYNHYHSRGLHRNLGEN
jgi:hypothetical protein